MRSLVTFILIPVCLWIMDPHRRAAKKNTSHGNGLLLQNSTHLMQRPRSSRQSDHTKTSWSSWRDANWSDMNMSPVHQVWLKPSCWVQWKREDDKADRRRGGKTTSGNGQAWSSPSLWGQWRTEKNGGNWLWNHLWCPNDLFGQGIGGGEGESTQNISKCLQKPCRIMIFVV